MTLWILFKTNFKIIIRDKKGFFWGIILPAGLYIALSILPVDSLIKLNIKYSTYLLPGIIAMTIMQAGIYSLAYWMVDLKSRGVVKRLQVTPLKKSELIISLLLSRALYMLIQVVFLTLLGVFFFGADFSGNLLFPFILTVLGGFVFLLFGLLIASFADTYHAAAPMTAGLGLPFIFLGNVFYPLDALPAVLQTIAKALPLNYLAEGFRTAYLSPENLEIIYKDLFILLVWEVAMFVLTLSIFKFEE
ncbi:MAG: ABC transporter permease [Candidatus Doudnabacteria bacterium]|nr:ABC transporter permease [Candidatus Doudnabacteria bacterium]